MTEHVKLEKIFFHRVVFKVRRNPLGVLIVRRMLDGAEVPDFVFLRNDDQTARVLPGGALDVDAAGGKPVFFRLGDGLVPLRQVLFCVAVGRFLCNSADRARAEDVRLAEHLHTVSVRLGLIFAREVEVDIGDLVAAEAEEGFKRDIESVLIELRAAFRADIAQSSHIISHRGLLV